MSRLLENYDNFLQTENTNKFIQNIKKYTGQPTNQPTKKMLKIKENKKKIFR